MKWFPRGLQVNNSDAAVDTYTGTEPFCGRMANDGSQVFLTVGWTFTGKQGTRLKGPTWSWLSIGDISIPQVELNPDADVYI